MKRGVLRYIEQNGLVSAMNATKWRETTEAMRQLPGGPPQFRRKDLRWPYPEAWEGEWFYHPRPWETIEWLEIRSEARTEQIAGILRTIGTPFTVENGNIRITGWLRPADGRS